MVTPSSYQKTSSSSDLLPELHRTVDKNGLHRDLMTEIKLPPTIVTEVECACHVQIHEHFTSGVYIDPFQLRSMVNFGGPRFLSPLVDVEQPEYRSSPLEVKLFTRMQKTTGGGLATNLTIPIHLRYHKISTNNDDNDASIFISNPIIYIKCDGMLNDIDNNNQRNSQNTSKSSDTKKAKLPNVKCYSSDIVKRKEILPCDSSNNNKKCEWDHIKYQSDIDAIQVNVPVGRKQDLNYVVFGTLTLTILSCVLIVVKVSGTSTSQEKKNK